MKAKELLTKYRYLSEHFNRDDYKKHYDAYKDVLLSFFAEHGDMQPEDIKTALEEILDETVKDINSKRWKFQKKDAESRDKIVLLLFMAPALMDLDKEEFAAELAAEWEKRIPDSPFKIGRYEDIVEGFRWKLFSK